MKGSPFFIPCEKEVQIHPDNLSAWINQSWKNPDQELTVLP
jgi:hypothetical protein